MSPQESIWRFLQVTLPRTGWIRKKDSAIIPIWDLFPTIKGNGFKGILWKGNKPILYSSLNLSYLSSVQFKPDKQLDRHLVLKWGSRYSCTDQEFLSLLFQSILNKFWRTLKRSQLRSQLHLGLFAHNPITFPMSKLFFEIGIRFFPFFQATAKSFFPTFFVYPLVFLFSCQGNSSFEKAPLSPK